MNEWNSGTSGMVGDWRVSICTVGPSSFTRVADFDEKGGQVCLKWVDADTPLELRSPDDPKTLYHPDLFRQAVSNGEGLIAVMWRLNGQRFPGKAFPTELDEGFQGSGKYPVREVVFLNNLDGDEELRAALERGFRVNGMVPERFFIAYRPFEEHSYLAVYCERSDFECDGYTLRLRKNVADPKGTALIAETYVLRKSDVIELIPGDGAPNRAVYRKAELPKPKGPIPLRPISYFAADYIKWFDGEGERALKRKEKRMVFEVIETALANPARLSGYLEGAEVSERERLDFESAIKECWNPESYGVEAIIVKALEEDREFFERCCSEIVKKGAPEVKHLSDEVAALEEKVSTAQNEINELDVRRKEAMAEIEGAEARKSELLEEMAELADNRMALEEELENSVALKVGLRAIGNRATSGATGRAPSIRPAKTLDCKIEVSDKSLKDALKRNLRSLGLTTTAEDVDPCGAMARLLASALKATNILAIDRASAYQVADAISLARSGKAASRISVPADWGDMGLLDELIDSSDCGAVVLENVFDTVNESVMFSLRRDVHGKTVILPVGALRNLHLVAPEAFASMVFIHDDSLAAFDPRPGARILQCCTDPLHNSVEDEDVESVVEDVAMFRREALKDSDADSSLLWNPVKIWDLVQKAPSKKEGDRVEQAMALLYPHFALICLSVDGVIPDEIDEMFEVHCDKTILARRLGFDE